MQLMLTLPNHVISSKSIQIPSYVTIIGNDRTDKITIAPAVSSTAKQRLNSITLMGTWLVSACLLTLASLAAFGEYMHCLIRASSCV